MSTEITQVQQWELTDEKIKILAQAGVIPPNTPPAQVQVFAEIARRHGLDPFSKEIHLVAYGSQYSAIIGIGGMRSRACDTGLHAGTEDAKFNVQPNGQYLSMAQLGKDAPVTASVTVYKIVGGQRVPFSATVSYSEFKGTSSKWREMPLNMISKVAESHALRKAFPRHTAGLYVSEEMDQANRETIEVSHVELPELTPTHPQWNNAVIAVSRGSERRNAEKKFEISDAAWNQLQTEAEKISKIVEQ